MYSYFFGDEEFEKEKAEVVSNIKPKLEKKIKELEESDDNEINKKILNQKKIILQCLDFYFSLN